MTTQTYEGWKKRGTWNCALWIHNQYALYKKACYFMAGYEGKDPYRDFIRWMGLVNGRTPDNFKWMGTRLSYSELNMMMKQLLT